MNWRTANRHKARQQRRDQAWLTAWEMTCCMIAYVCMDDAFRRVFGKRS